MEQFWTDVIWEDENGKEDDIHNSVMVSIYIPECSCVPSQTVLSVSSVSGSQPAFKGQYFVITNVYLNSKLTYILVQVLSSNIS